MRLAACRIIAEVCSLRCSTAPAAALMQPRDVRQLDKTLLVFPRPPCAPSSTRARDSRVTGLRIDQTWRLKHYGLGTARDREKNARHRLIRELECANYSPSTRGHNRQTTVFATTAAAANVTAKASSVTGVLATAPAARCGAY